MTNVASGTFPYATFCRMGDTSNNIKAKKNSPKLLQKGKRYSKIAIIKEKEGEETEICTHSRYAF